MGILHNNSIIPLEIEDGKDLETRVSFTPPGHSGSSTPYLSTLLKGGGDYKIVASGFTLEDPDENKAPTVPEKTVRSMAHWVNMIEGVSGEFPQLWKRLEEAGNLGESDFFWVDRAALTAAAPQTREEVITFLRAHSLPLSHVEKADGKRDQNRHLVHYTSEGGGPSSTTLDIMARNIGGKRLLVEVLKAPLPAEQRIDIYRPSSDTAAMQMNSSVLPEDDAAVSRIETEPLPHILDLFKTHWLNLDTADNEQLSFIYEGPGHYVIAREIKNSLVQRHGLHKGSDEKYRGKLQDMETLYQSVYTRYRRKIIHTLGRSAHSAFLRRINTAGLINPLIEFEITKGGSLIVRFKL